MIIVYDRENLDVLYVDAQTDTLSNETLSEIQATHPGVELEYFVKDYTPLDDHTVTCTLVDNEGELDVVIVEYPLSNPQRMPTEVDILTDYIVDVDFRVTMIELGLL